MAGGLLEASRGVDRFDAINASTLPSDFLGHSYYANQGSMLGDIYCLLKGTQVKERPRLVLSGPAWQFRPQEELTKLDGLACSIASAPAVQLAGGSPPSGQKPSWWPVVGTLAAVVLLIAGVLWLLRRRTSAR